MRQLNRCQLASSPRATQTHPLLLLIGQGTSIFSSVNQTIFHPDTNQQTLSCFFFGRTQFQIFRAAPLKFSFLSTLSAKFSNSELKIVSESERLNIITFVYLFLSHVPDFTEPASLRAHSSAARIEQFCVAVF